MSKGLVYEQRPWLKYYSAQVPGNIPPITRSVSQCFDEATEKWKNKTAIVFYGSGITLGELRAKADRLAAALYDLGVKKGDRVAILLLNCPEYAVAFHGIAKTGAVGVPISSINVASEIRHQLEDSGAKTIICQDILYQEVAKTGISLQNVILTSIDESLRAEEKPALERVLRDVYMKKEVPSTDIFKRAGFYRLEDLIKKYPPSPPRVKINVKKDLISILYTGGTTGLSKGTMLTHYNYLAMEIQINTWYPYEDGKDITVAFGPLYHVGGQVHRLFHALVHGHTIVLLARPDTDVILESIIRYGATFFAGVPTLFERLLDYEGTYKVDWRRLKFVTCGADTLYEDTAKAWEDRTGVKLHNLYGMTECPGVMHNPFGQVRNGSIGIPVSGVVAGIADPSKNEFLPVGEIGEIVVRGPQVTVGYWNRPEATERSTSLINGKLWFRTDDLGKMDEDGYFYILGRKGDLIKYKGLRIHATEVEQVIKEHPAVKEVGVIGVPDLKVGQIVKAVVIPNSDYRGKVQEKDIIEYCQGKLSHYKIPKIVELADELPRTSMGKLRRGALG